MAKMFYTLEEAAERLGVGEDEVKEMASRGELQQFRDRDKLMFKRDQVDAAAGPEAEGNGNGDDATSLLEESAGPIALAESGGFDLSDTRADEAIDLADESVAPSPGSTPGASTGVSVFDAGEIDLADPMAQTQVTRDDSGLGLGGDEDLALESVGSGSGLLDLTRESDDTSLGAELLDDIYTGGGTAADVPLEASAAGSSGVFDSAVAMETGASTPGGFDNLGGSDMAEEAEVAAPAAPVLVSEPSDSAGSGFGAGVMLGVLVTLVLGLFVVIPAMAGFQSKVFGLLAGDPVEIMRIWMVAGGLFVVSVVLGVGGALIGKASG
ncbi:MAG: excisionase family DNA-binding protein [Planctomycetota bacterium]